MAPAKNLECGIEAVNHGADAIYIGAPKFGARADAVNSLEDMQWCIDRGVDYITTDEPERLQELLRSQRSFHDVAGFLPVYGKFRDCKNPLYSLLSSE